MAKPFILLLRYYQVFFSPDHSWRKIYYPYGFCRFSPSCSQYGIDSLRKRGVLKGLALAFWRVLRCHPWSAGGNDEVK